MAEIDLEKPQSLLASAENAKDYTFYLFLPKPNYTAEAFESNPNCVAAADLLFKSAVVPDKDGRASVDLAPKAKEIKDKLKSASTDAKGVVLATETGPIGRKKAVMESFTLKKNATDLEVKGLVTSRSAQDWICYHHSLFFVEVVPKGDVTDLVADVNPKTQPIPIICGIWEQSAPGEIGIKKLVLGGVGDCHPPNPKCKFDQAQHPQWAQLWGAQASRGFVQWKATPEARYVVGVYPRFAGTWTLTVRGTGGHGAVEKQVTLAMNGPHPHPGD